MARSTGSISAQNTFSDPIWLNGPFDLSLSGTFSATVHLQRCISKGYNNTPAAADFFDVASYTVPTEDNAPAARPGWYRVGIKTGNYTSGTATWALADEGN
jgi:hypothetical protein